MSSLAEKTCVYCGKAPRRAGFAPFCSAGCQDRDLVQWLREGYVVPVRSDDDEADGNSRLDNDG